MNCRVKFGIYAKLSCRREAAIGQSSAIIIYSTQLAADKG